MASILNCADIGGIWLACVVVLKREKRVSQRTLVRRGLRARLPGTCPWPLVVLFG